MMRPFGKNAFSVKAPRYLKTPPVQAAKLISVIQGRYMGLHPRRISTVAAFGVNSRNWRVETSDESYILKESNAEKIRTLSRQAEWSHALRRRGFPTPAFVPAKNGHIVCQAGPSSYCLSRFETGNYFEKSLSSWEELLRSHRDLIKLSRALPKKMRNGLPRRDYFTRSEARVSKWLGSVAKLPGLSREQTVYAAGLHERLLKVYQNERKQMRRAVYHIDVHPLNLIFRGGRTKLFVDFESFQNTWLEISLGFSLYKCAREIFVARGGFSNKLIWRLAGSFSKYFPDLELRKLLLFGQMDVLKRFLWIAGELMEKGVSSWDFMLTTQGAGLKEIDVMREALGGGKCS